MSIFNLQKFTKFVNLIFTQKSTLNSHFENFLKKIFLIILQF